MTAFIGTFSMAQDCSELFISEYAEGWSNNKAIEIYNPTGADIDLSRTLLFVIQTEQQLQLLQMLLNWLE